MSEINKQIDNSEIQGISDRLNKLDKEYDKNSSKLSRELLKIEEKIEELESNEKIKQKYGEVLRELKNELNDLREDGDIDKNHKNLSELIHNNLDSINIPKGHIVEYEGVADGNNFIISKPEDGSSYDNYKLIIDKNGKQETIEIKSLVRYRDGGTTLIKTDIGEFYFPTPFNEDEISTFTNTEGKKTNIETGKEINLLGDLNKINGTELFTKNKDLFTKIHNNFYNQNIITNDILNTFKSKVRDYVENNGYELKEGFGMKADPKGYFIIEPEFLEKTPDNDYETDLQLWFG